MRIIVLNDGETYTEARGSLLLDISTEVEDSDIKTIAETLEEWPNWRRMTYLAKDGQNVGIEVIARF